MDKMKDGRRKRSAPDFLSNKSNASFLQATDNADDRFYSNNPSYTRYTLYRIGGEGTTQIIYDKNFKSSALQPQKELGAKQTIESQAALNNSQNSFSEPEARNVSSIAINPLDDVADRRNTATFNSLVNFIEEVQKFELFFRNNDGVIGDPIYVGKFNNHPIKLN